ncbi:Acyl transferase hydrolase [Apiospora arundinis]
MPSTDSWTDVGSLCQADSIRAPVAHVRGYPPGMKHEGRHLVLFSVDALGEPVRGGFARPLRDEVEPVKSLMAYGLDSLSAIELRNWAQQRIGV